ncbi:4-hydroxybenzoate decarboxylase subunit C [Anatilimnocola aggregata]|uniref:4-hydroxybenzoate decarboxylase subunit C n=1 Tax=Anatilimnocola aggregata TaxID=2528021 RepID=A0A517Y9G0_9BACT|nr:UbiD family decarboxylase [Anatilimnocola aggregata]QDU26868.1 4-hydroxybenzoate decarboxylase subunit C [Anatilimnocola aggregata]
MSSLRQLMIELVQAGHAVRWEHEVDGRLEAAEIQRRVYARSGPAIWFTRVKNCRFEAVSNLFGTIERARYLFRHSYEAVRRAIELKIEPAAALRQPWRYWSAPFTAWHMQPKLVRGGPVFAQRINIGDLPQIQSWPGDGGPFITLPQVFTEDPRLPGLAHSNLGMYRVQLSGNSYAQDREIGLHYQIHRGIGVHHAAALANGEPLRVNIFVGGHPAMSLAAVMPLPEGMSELSFAGALAGERIRMANRATPSGNNLPVYADADFCIRGVIRPGRNLPEGPFGDHLGYYSLAHDFPVLEVEEVLARKDAIWPFTVVGRPPQEDTTFGQLIHELTGPIIPTVVPGVQQVHAVDAAGVHPLLLAVGSERYMPFHANPQPQELLTQACAILGQGQMSLAKYLLIANQADDTALDTHDEGAFLQHILKRVDWRRDLHFHTCTTIDTLDYSGDGLNRGSKVVIAAVGPPRRTLATQVPTELRLPEGYSSPRFALPGVIAVSGPPIQPQPSFQQRPEQPIAATWQQTVERFCEQLKLSSRPEELVEQIPLIVIVDDSDFASRTLGNFLWVTFTRSNPAADIYGVGAATMNKHWGCIGPLVIDARIKPHHAPPLIEDPAVSKRVDALAAQGGPLAKWL